MFSLHPLFAPYCTDAVVCYNGKCCDIKVLRDTAALQSLLLESSVPSTAYTHTGEIRLLKGISGPPLKVPLVEIHLRTDFMDEKVLCGLIRELPEGVDFLLGNDLWFQSHPLSVETQVDSAVTLAQAVAEQMSKSQQGNQRSSSQTENNTTQQAGKSDQQLCGDLDIASVSSPGELKTVQSNDRSTESQMSLIEPQLLPTCQTGHQIIPNIRNMAKYFRKSIALPKHVVQQVVHGLSTVLLAIYLLLVVVLVPKLVSTIRSCIDFFFHLASKCHVIISFCRTWKDHVHFLQQAMERIRQAGLTLKWLTDLLHKGVKFVRTVKTESAFLDFKSRLASRPILRPPNFDSPFCVAVDASNVAIGANLFQVVDNVEHPVCYYSKRLDIHQKRYSTVEKEALALVTAVRTFSPYFGSQPITVYTDHSPLQFVQRMSNYNQKLLRWALELQQYNLRIVHRPGKFNLIPDILSRPSE